MARIKILGPKRFDKTFARKNEVDVDAMGGLFQRNKRPCNCKRCGSDQLANTAVKHMSTSNGWHFRWFYLCLPCTVAVRLHMNPFTTIFPPEFNSEIERLREEVGMTVQELKETAHQTMEYNTG